MNKIQLMVKISKIGLLLILCFGLYALYVSIPSDTLGYCDKQKLFLTDEEFIEIAVRDEFRTGRMNVDGSEESFRAFHAMNSDCCSVDRSDRRNFLEKMIGASYSVEVLVAYEVNVEWLNRSTEKFYVNNLVINPCGDVLDTYGMGTNSTPSALKASGENI